MINVITLTGNMTRDPEARAVGDKTVCNFTLAVNRPWKTDDVDFIRCQAWGAIAENTAKYCSKGSKVAVTGRLQIRNYEDKEGAKKTIAEVNCSQVQFLDSKKDNNNSGSTPSNPSPEDNPIEGKESNEEIPF